MKQSSLSMSVPAAGAPRTGQGARRAVRCASPAAATGRDRQRERSGRTGCAADALSLRRPRAQRGRGRIPADEGRPGVPGQGRRHDRRHLQSGRGEAGRHRAPLPSARHHRAHHGQLGAGCGCGAPGRCGGGTTTGCGGIGCKARAAALGWPEAGERRRQLHPDCHPAVGLIPIRLGREVFLERFQHDIATLGISLRRSASMRTGRMRSTVVWYQPPGP